MRRNSEDGSFEVRRARLDEVGRLAEIESRSSARPWSRRLLEAELRNRHSTVLIADLEGFELAGFLVYWTVVDELHLLNLAVDLDFRRLGAATVLLDAMLSDGGSRKARSVLLEVRQDNLAAKSLYLSYGFRPVGIRPRYYPAEGKDAISMELSL